MEVNDDFIELALDMASEKDEKIELKDYHQDYGNASALFPRTRSEIAFSSFHGRLSLEYYRIEHLTRFELFSFLSGQLAIRAFKQGSLGHFDISPRLDLSLTSKLSLEMIAGKNTSGLGFYYKFRESFSAGFFAGKARESYFLDLEARYSPSKTSKVSFGLGSVFEHFLLTYEKKFESGSFSLYLKEIQLNIAYGLRGKWKIFQDLKLFYSAQFSEVPQLNKQAIGLQVRLGEHLKLENIIEEQRNSCFWVLVVKRGTFSISFPVRIEKIPRIVSLFGVCVFAVVARGLFRAFFKGNDDKKALKQKEFSTEFVQMVEGKVRENMQAEELKQGLVVIRGLFGKKEDILKNIENGAEGLFIDVTIPLNFMVDDSKLKIPSQKKESLQGFYFVCDPSVLFIHYKIRGQTQEVFIRNTEELIIS